MNRELTYDVYHSKRKIQKRIISDSNFTYINLIGIIRKYLGKRQTRILDIGCGVGTISFYLASKGHYVTGIDLSESAIKMAKKNAKVLHLENNLEFLLVDFPKNSIKDKFQVVLISEVLEHLNDDKKAIKLAYGLLEKGGTVIASCPSSNAPLYKLGLLDNFDKEVGHLRRYTLKKLIELFKTSGFNVIESVKTEGFIRNFLYTNKVGEKFIKFIRGPISYLVSALDSLTIRLFGESQIFVIAKK